MYGYIYKIINKVNGKMYIGQTINFQKRIKDHFKDLEEGKHHSVKLQRAYDKYGKDNFYYEYKLVEIDSHDDLLRLEMEEIDKCDSYNNGYNMTLGGDGNRLNISLDDRICVYYICKQYSGIFRKTALYFKVDPSCIHDIANNKLYSKYPKNEDRINILIKEIGIKEENLNENYVDHTKKKLSKDDCLYILCILHCNPDGNYVKPLAEIFNIHNKGIARLRDGVTYKEYRAIYEQLTEEEKTKISNIGLKKYRVEEVKNNRMRRNKKNTLTQEQVNYILDNKDIKKRVEIAKDLGITADRVGGVILGKYYKDLVQNYYDKNCHE